MQTFLLIALAHFLALLSPGPDFFLIARCSLTAGWRVASGACAGIAAANGVFVAAAFAGFAALRPGSTAFLAIQAAGCLYLLRLGVLFVRHAGRGGTALVSVATTDDGTAPARSRRTAWWRAAGAGFLSAILNPKNALFYASLAAMLGAAATPAARTLYGAWMVFAVLAWDLLVAMMIGNRHVLRRFAAALRWFERASGAVLIALAAGIAVLMLRAMR